MEWPFIPGKENYQTILPLNIFISEPPNTSLHRSPPLTQLLLNTALHPFSQLPLCLLHSSSDEGKEAPSRGRKMTSGTKPHRSSSTPAYSHQSPSLSLPLPSTPSSPEVAASPTPYAAPPVKFELYHLLSFDFGLRHLFSLRSTVHIVSASRRRTSSPSLRCTSSQLATVARPQLASVADHPQPIGVKLPDLPSSFPDLPLLRQAYRTIIAPLLFQICLLLQCSLLILTKENEEDRFCYSGTSHLYNREGRRRRIFF